MQINKLKTTYIPLQAGKKKLGGNQKEKKLGRKPWLTREDKKRETELASSLLFAEGINKEKL